MKIDWNFDADLVKVEFKYDPKSEQRIVTPTVALHISEKIAREKLGDRFASLIFASLSDGRFAYKTIKPTLVVEKHTVMLNDRGPLPTMPTIDKVEPTSGTHVGVFLKLPFVLEDSDVIVGLVENFNEGVRVEMKPVQLPLPGMTAGERQDTR